MDETTAKIKQFIVEEFMPDVPAEELEDDFDLLTGGVVDSLGLLKVVAWLEDEFDIGVDDSELGPDSFRTVAAIKEYVDAAKASGASSFRIITRHMLPNIVGPIAVNTTLVVGYAILLESTLSFLGFGIQPPTPSWGNLLAGSQSQVFTARWLIYFPGLFILITVLCVNFLGDGLRDALDPTQRRVRA